MKNELKMIYNKHFKDVPPDMIHEAFNLVFELYYNDGPQSTIKYYVFFEERTYCIEYLVSDKSFVSITSIPNARVYAAIINNEFNDINDSNSSYYYRSEQVNYRLFESQLCKMIESNIFHSVKCPYCGVRLKNHITKNYICDICGRTINYEDIKIKTIHQFLSS